MSTKNFILCPQRDGSFEDILVKSCRFQFFVLSVELFCNQYWLVSQVASLRCLYSVPRLRCALSAFGRDLMASIVFFPQMLASSFMASWSVSVGGGPHEGVGEDESLVGVGARAAHHKCDEQNSERCVEQLTHCCV